MAFLHGVETITIQSGNRTITVVPSSIITLVGIAPEGDRQTPILVTGTNDLAQFGSRLPGFNIPEALDTIFAGGSGVVVVINVFDDEDNVAAVTSETATITDGKFKLAFAPVGGVAPVVKNGAGDVTYVVDEDYTIDAFGNGTVVAGSSISAGSVKVTYKKLDASTVSDAQIIGTVTGQDRTGMKLIDNIPTLFGFKPKLLLLPGYSGRPAVSVEMASINARYRAISYIDGPEEQTVSAAISARAAGGTIGWNVANSRIIPCHSLWKKSNPDPRAASGSTILEWYSSVMTSLTAKVDRDLGFWFSPSNQALPAVLGPEVVITNSYTDSSAQNQLLNAAGIISYLAPFGGGYKSWGNRSSLYPTDTQAVNFIVIQRIKDVLEESVEQAMLPYVDQPINSGLIDAIRNTVNNFIRTLIGRGALIDGSCTFDPSQNTSEDLAAGQVKFTLTFMGPTPAERITFYSFVDTSLLSKLLAA